MHLLLKRLILLVLLFAVGQVNAAEHFKAGVHYQVIESASSAPATQEVIEFLWYGCSTCYAIQGQVQRWLSKKKPAINYKRVPAVTEPKMEPLARAFYIASLLDKLDEVHIPLFTAINVHHRPLQEEAELRQFFIEHAVKGADFDRILHSGYIKAQLRKAKAMAVRFGISGAPTLVVNGRYRIDPNMVRSAREMFEVVDFLLSR